MIMNNNSYMEQMNPIYSAFNEPGFHWGLFWPAFMYAIIAMIGIPLNASVCWVTIKNSSLRGNTCILLALDSFFAILHQLGHFNFLVIAFSGINFYPLRLALPIQIYSVIGVYSGSMQVALLGFDRLFSIMAPLYYRQLDQRKYIFGHLLANAAITSFNLTQMIPAANSLAEWPCTGFIADLMTLPNLPPILWTIGLGIFSATILAYLLVGIMVRLKTEAANERQQKIYFSLFLIVLINVGSQFFSFILNLLFNLSLIPVSLLQFWYINIFTNGLFLNIGIISNAPILYYNSIDYRNAYKKEFKSFRLFRIIFIRGQEQSSTIIRVYPIAKTQMNIK